MNAFVDEFGQFGFDFSKKGVSERFIVAAVLCCDYDRLAVEKQALALRNSKWFQGQEMKSKTLGSDGQKWLDVCVQISQIPVSLWGLVVDKSRLYGEGVTGSKQQFYRYLNGLLFKHLYQQYPNLSIVADMHGHDDFMLTFKKHVQGKQDLPLFAHAKGYIHEFGFRDSKDSILVQLADLVAGALARCFEPDKILPQTEQIRALIFSMQPRIEYFPREARGFAYLGEHASQEEKHDALVAQHCFEAVEAFLDEHAGTEDETMKHRLLFLRILRDHCRYDGDGSYVQTYMVANQLNRCFIREPEFDPKYVTRTIVPFLRSQGLIIASTSRGGYKIPTKLDDVYEYLNHCNHILEPMLRRMFRCHETVRSITDKVELLRKECYRVAWLCFQDYLMQPTNYGGSDQSIVDAPTEDEW